MSESLESFKFKLNLEPLGLKQEQGACCGHTGHMDRVIFESTVRRAFQDKSLSLNQSFR